MNKAPYDEKNQADYLEMTERIESALNNLRDDSSIPATEMSLSKLAGCSRNTLRNRKYPLEELKKIKNFRIQRSEIKPVRITKAHFLIVDEHIQENRRLKLQLEQSRTEIAVWVNKYFELETENKGLERMNGFLAEAKKSLESQLNVAKDPQTDSDDFSIH